MKFKLKELLEFDDQLEENYDPYRLTRPIHKVAMNWPQDEQNYLQTMLGRLASVIPLICSSVMFVYSLTGFAIAKSIDDMSEVVSLVAVTTAALGRTFFLFLFKEKLHGLVRQTIEMEKAGPSDKICSSECIIINKWRFIQDSVAKMFLFGFLVGGAMYVILPILLSKVPAPGYLNARYNTPTWFYTIYLIQTVAICIYTPCWISVDFYICSFLCQLCKHLDALYDVMQNLQDKDRAYLCAIIEKHNRVLDYGSEVCDIVSYAFGVIHVPYAMFLIFGTIAMTQISLIDNSGLALRNLITMFVCMSSLALMCFIGDLVQDYSTQLGDGIILENYPDHNKDKKFLKLLEIVYARCCCSLQIKYSPNMVVNMAMYSVTINYIMSIYTFARTVMA